MNWFQDRIDRAKLIIIAALFGIVLLFGSCWSCLTVGQEPTRALIPVRDAVIEFSKPLPPAIVFDAYNVNGPICQGLNFIVYIQWEGSPGQRDTAELIVQALDLSRDKIATKYFGGCLEGREFPIEVLATIRNVSGQTSGGTTTRFDDGSISMTLEGSVKQVAEDAGPHEVSHSVLMDRYGEQIIPWIDEGLAYNQESESSKQYNRETIKQLNQDPNRPSWNTVFSSRDFVKERPIGHCHLYAFSAVEFLIAAGGARNVLGLVQGGTLESNFRIKSLKDFNILWNDWYWNGCQTVENKGSILWWKQSKQTKSCVDEVCTITEEPGEWVLLSNQ